MKDSRIRVLIVDDEHAIRVVLKDLLESQGYIVATATDGIDAIRQLVEPLPDVILSDLNMPVMSGHEFMFVVRRRFPQIPVIAISGEFRNGERPGHIPADVFYSKGSYYIDELCGAIEKLKCSSPLRPPAALGNNAPSFVSIDEDGTLSLQCPNCLRPFQMAAAGLNGGLHTAQCNSCQAFLDFRIDHQHKTEELQ